MLASSPALSEKKAESPGAGEESGENLGMTIQDTAPTLEDETPTLDFGSLAEGEPPAHASSEVEGAAPEAEHVVASAEKCVVQIGEIEASAPAPSNADAGSPEEEIAGEQPVGDQQPQTGRECVNITDAEPSFIGADGKPVPIAAELKTQDMIGQRLQERRLELETLSGDFEMQEAILAAAEKQIEERTAALEQLKVDIDATLAKAEEAESGKLEGLIATYESMKPAAAAAIFNEMPDEVLLTIARAMSPRKIAPILSKMRPDRAAAITVKLATVEE